MRSTRGPISIVSETKKSPAERLSHSLPGPFGLLFQFATTNELYKISAVSPQYQVLATAEILKRRAMQTKDVSVTFHNLKANPPIFQIRLFFDEHKKLTIDVKLNNITLPVCIPLFNKTCNGNLHVFHCSKNRLHISSINISSDLKDSRINFSNGMGAVLLQSRPFAAIEPSVYASTDSERRLIDAVKSNDTPSIISLRALLEYGVSVNTRDEKGIPLLALAVLNGNIKKIELLINHGADIDARFVIEGAQTNALLEAGWALNSNPINFGNIIKLLVERGADVNAQSSSGKALLHYLVIKNSSSPKELLTFLLEKGANLKQLDLLNRRPIDIPHSNTDYTRQLFCAAMDSDPVIFFTHWSYEKNIYTLHFKPNLWDDQRVNAFEAIANKLKSLKTDDPNNIGLANDRTRAIFKDQGHAADVTIPLCAQYAICEIHYREDTNCLIVRLSNDYLNNQYVHNAIRQVFVMLGLYSSIEKAKQEKEAKIVLSVATKETLLHSVTLFPSPTIAPVASLVNSAPENRSNNLSQGSIRRKT